MKPDVALQLHQIARALDVPVEAFFADAPADRSLMGAVELLRCWHTIEDAEQREQLLTLARDLSGQPVHERIAAE